MELTQEQLDAAFTAKPEILTGFIEAKGFKVFKEQDLKSRDEELQSRWAREKTSEFYNGLDKDIEDVYGVKRPAEKKTYDFNKEFHIENKNNRAKIKELEAKIAAGSQDETLKSQLKALQDEIPKYTAALAEKDKAIFEKDVKIEIKEGLRELKFDASIPDDVRKTYIEATTNKLLSAAIIENGKVVFKIDDRVVLDDKGQAASAEYILKGQLKSILEKGIQQPGAGSGQPGAGEKNKDITTLPAEVNTQGKLMDYMLQLGHIKGTKEFDTLYANFAKGLPIR